MLKITTITNHEVGRTLRLEGKLVGPWVEELALVCDESAHQHDRLRLDLSAVSFVDAAGVALLRELLRRGVALAECSGLVAELLHREGR
jgi:ABC-type transporter Mla MlaB component